jgi:hypothetical protein
MVGTASTYKDIRGGRGVLLFLLFLLALANFYAMGITGLALICLIPAGILFLTLSMKNQNLMFWFFFTINYFVMGLQRYGYIPIPITLVTLGPQFLLLMSFIIIPRPESKNSMGTPMLLGIIIWTLYLVLQIFNQTCQLPISVTYWLQNMNFFAFYFLLCYIIINKVVNTPENVMKFLRLWAIFTFVATYWAWRQKTFGWDSSENAWLMGGAMRTHIIGGSIRYFSLFSDAANFGCSTGASAAVFFIIALTSKLRKDKILFWIAGACSTYSFFTSGTRSGLLCFMVGIVLYMFLSKSFKLTTFVVVVGGIFLFFLACTKIGNGNMQIRRMRTAFDSNDASKNVRDMNKEALAKYLKDAPFGMGINIDETNIPAFNKYKVVYETSNDSTYVFFWQRTGIVGVFVFAFMNILILLGGSIITLTRLRSTTCKGIAAALCCGFLGIQTGGYANHILLQYPNLVLFYGGMAIVYLLPAIESDFIAYEEKELAKEEERKRLKLEKKKKKRRLL